MDRKTRGEEMMSTLSTKTPRQGKAIVVTLTQNEDQDAEIDPVQAERGGGVQEPLLSNSCPSSWTSSTRLGEIRSATPVT